MPEVIRKERTWQAVEVRAAARAAEAVEFALEELGTIGTFYAFPSAQGTETVVVTGYFEERQPRDMLEARLASALSVYECVPDSVKGFEWKTVDDEDWLAEWKRNWKPTVTELFVVAPPWADVDAEGRAVIRVEPGMAFGTGTHETTRLCLEAIEKHYRPGMSFFDVGTGTGILAIAAAKISEEDAGAAIAACDTDPEAVAIAEENARLNECGRIGFFVGSAGDDPAEYDFVCANLTADAILPIIPQLLARSGHLLVLSGILAEQEQRILTALEYLGVTDVAVGREGEWISLVIPRANVAGRV